METTRKSIAEKRVSTDTSLVHERASANAFTDHAVTRARRLADDLIERDRIIVDEQLRRFRDIADAVLVHERLASSAPEGIVTSERTLADLARVDERANNDAIRDQERQRSDDAVLAQREAQATDPNERKHRANTDEKLGEERRRVDSALTFLGHTEKALSVATDEIERRSNVLAMVAHELRNPLAVIAMNSEFIAEGLDSADDREAATEVQHSVARMNRLLLDLLDVARIDGGMLRIVKQPLDVGALLTEISAAYGPLFTKRGVHFACAPTAPGINADFDHDRILQVLSNLLSNAMKFTAPGGTVSLCMQRSPDESIELAVKDTGSGIPGAALPHVFNRFWQGCGAPGTGLGLGLYICDKIVAAHAGRMWVESELGKGTTFRFTLPASL